MLALGKRSPRHAPLADASGDFEALDAAVADVTREAREAQVTQAAKVSAIAAHDTLFASVANVAEGLLTLVGENDLARRVRPSARRPGVTASDEGSDDAPDGAAPDPKGDAPNE